MLLRLTPATILKNVNSLGSEVCIELKRDIGLRLTVMVLRIAEEKVATMDLTRSGFNSAWVVAQPLRVKIS